MSEKKLKELEEARRKLTEEINGLIFEPVDRFQRRYGTQVINIEPLSNAENFDVPELTGFAVHTLIDAVDAVDTE